MKYLKQNEIASWIKYIYRKVPFSQERQLVLSLSYVGVLLTTQSTAQCRFSVLPNWFVYWAIIRDLLISNSEEIAKTYCVALFVSILNLFKPRNYHGGNHFSD